MSAHLIGFPPLNSDYFRSTIQVPPSIPIQRPVIEHSSSTSRIEEVSNYDPGSVSIYRPILGLALYSSKPKGYPQQDQYHQFQGVPSNQQTQNFVQATPQRVGISSYQSMTQQRTPMVAKVYPQTISAQPRP